MPGSIRFSALVIGLLLMAVVSSYAQFGYKENKLKTNADNLIVDYAFFQADQPDRYRLEIYYQIHNRGLQFESVGDRLVADYELVVTVKNDDDEQIERYSRDRKVVLASGEQARTRTDFRTSQINVEVPSGTYKVLFKLKDRVNDRRTIKELKVKPEGLFESKPRMSMIEFAQAFQDSDDSGSVFAKGSILVIPSVHRTYGSLEDDRVAFYYDIYRGSDEFDKVVVETKVRHYRKGMLYRDTIHLDLEEPRHRRLQEVSLASFLPGSYELEIHLRGRRNRALAFRRQEFTISWSQEGMVRNDWKAVVQQLKLFSEDVDVDDMEDLKEFVARQAAFDQFWSERDPTEGTPENEAKMAFYYRVRLANESFGVMRQDGWRSDRGRVFIRWGEPDHLVEEPFSLDRPPFQIWTYSRLSPLRKFYFIDESNDGDYRLQYPFDGLGFPGGF
jgi:GWxTD domain-containing protein